MSSRKSFLLDADAVVHLHSLDLIDPLVDAARTGKLALHCTRCVWEHELSALRDVREALEGAGLQVHEVAPSSPAGAFFKRLVRDRGNPGRNSRGELHLIAWAATHQSSDIALVAREAGARDLAAKHGVWALDLADFLSELVCEAVLDEETVRTRLVPWDNPYAGNGRPKGYGGFSVWLDRWRQERRPPDGKDGS